LGEKASKERVAVIKIARLPVFGYGYSAVTIVGNEGLVLANVCNELLFVNFRPSKHEIYFSSIHSLFYALSQFNANQKTDF